MALSLTQDEVKEISSRSIRDYDKWYRMCAGISSDLVRYEDGVIYLSMCTTGKNGPPNYELAVRFVGFWMRWNPELADAKGFVVTFYKTEFTGFMLKITDTNKDAISALAAQIKASASAEHKLINIFSGVLPEKQPSSPT